MDRLAIEQARVHPTTNSRRAPMALGPTKNSLLGEIKYTKYSYYRLPESKRWQIAIAIASWREGRQEAAVTTFLIFYPRRGILFIGLLAPHWGCGWRWGLRRDACIPGSRHYTSQKMLKSIQEPNEIFLF